MSISPSRIERITEEALAAAAQVAGHLTERDGRFLGLAAAAPTTEGAVLEIGSFKGKSTVLLATAAQLAGHPCVVAVDPLNSPGEFDVDLGGKPTDPDDFRATMRRARVEESVEFHHMLSQELAVSWDRPIRMLWIDGDHTYRGTKSDFDLFAPHLADRAIIAFHDVLSRFDGPIRVFMEDVLLSPQFGAAGICGSIGWAQYHKNAHTVDGLRTAKLSLYSRLSRLIPFAVFRNPRERLPFLDYLRWRICRIRVPHSRPAAAHWMRQVGLIN